MRYIALFLGWIPRKLSDPISPGIINSAFFSAKTTLFPICHPLVCSLHPFCKPANMGGRRSLSKLLPFKGKDVRVFPVNLFAEEVKTFSNNLEHVGHESWALQTVSQKEKRYSGAQLDHWEHILLMSIIFPRAKAPFLVWNVSRPMTEMVFWGEVGVLTHSTEKIPFIAEMGILSIFWKLQLRFWFSDIQEVEFGI